MTDLCNSEEIKDLGFAGFLRILPIHGADRYQGAMLTINARGEPIEFTYNFIETHSPASWRGVDIRQYSIRRLTASILKKCSVAPLFVLYLNQEVHPRLFLSEIRLKVPVCEIEWTHQETARPTFAGGDGENPVSLRWIPEEPTGDSAARALFSELSPGALMDAFERAAAGLNEVFKTHRPE